MSKQIHKILPNALVQGNINPPRSGAFEITINDELVYSKFETNQFPTEEEIKKILDS